MRFLSFVFIFLANCVWASDLIRVPLGKLPVGTLMVYESSSGSVQVRRLVRADDQGFQLDRLSSSSNRPVSSSMLLDVEGRVIGERYPSGREYRYEPHNCSRVIGECAFEMTNPIGDRHKRKYRSVLKDGTLHVDVMNDHDHVLEQYQIIYDETGMVLSVFSEQTDSQDKPASFLKLVGLIQPGEQPILGVSVSE